MSHNHPPTQWLIDQQKWHRAEVARFNAGKPDDARLAAEALTWVQKYLASDDQRQRRIAAEIPDNASQQEKWHVLFAKVLINDEHAHYQAAVNLLAAFAQARGIDASSLPDGPDALQTLRRIEAAIRVALAEEPAKVEPLGVVEKPADPFADLRTFAKTELKGYQRAVVEALCNGNGEVTLKDVKEICGWQPPIDYAWNALRGRLNRKLAPLGYEVATHDRRAVLRQSVTAHPKQTRRKRR